MRLIDVDDLMDDINRAINEMTAIGIAVDGDWLWAKLNDAVDNAPTIDPGPQWIPCSERLPEKYSDVLCCDTHGEYIIGMPYEDEESNTGFSVENDSIYMIDCIAWVPLPDRYTEDKR